MERGEQMALLSGVAGSQWGLFTAAQAKNAGLSAVQLLRLTEASLIENVGRGVYLVVAAGFPEHLEAKVAWLRLQPKTYVWDRTTPSADSGVVSHASACQLHELGDVPAPDITLSVPRRRTTTEPAVRLRIADLTAAEVTVVDGLPVTTATRTIVDLMRSKTDGGHVGGVIVDAERRELIDLNELADLVRSYAPAYGLDAAASGLDLIEHLAGQSGQQLRAQDLTEASKQGFADAVELLSAQPQLSKALQQAVSSHPARFSHTAYRSPLSELLRNASRSSSLGDSIRAASGSPHLAKLLRDAIGINPPLSASVRDAMAELAAASRSRTGGAFDSLAQDALKKALGTGASEGLGRAFGTTGLAAIDRASSRHTLPPAVLKGAKKSASASPRKGAATTLRPAPEQAQGPTNPQLPDDEPQ